jgi:IS5 family transposase
LLEPLLEQINHHLEQNSIIVSLGSINIIDATVIEAKQSPNGGMVWHCFA